jgi:hypothetical protein
MHRKPPAGIAIVLTGLFVVLVAAALVAASLPR